MGHTAFPVPLGKTSHFDVSRSRVFYFLPIPGTSPLRTSLHLHRVPSAPQAMLPVAPEAVDLPKPFGLCLAGASESTEAADSDDAPEENAQSQFRGLRDRDGSKVQRYEFAIVYHRTGGITIINMIKHV